MKVKMKRHDGEENFWRPHSITTFLTCGIIPIDLLLFLLPLTHLTIVTSPGILMAMTLLTFLFAMTVTVVNNQRKAA